MNNKIDLAHVAKLARLKLDPDKVEQLTTQMENIIQMCETLPPCDGEIQVDPQNKMELRADEVVPSFNRAEIMSNAPMVEAGCYVVPKTVSE